jgi:hypothetical protein
MTYNVDAETLSRRRRLAQDVESRLVTSGFQMAHDTSTPSTAGVRVVVDPSADDTGGVYVGWRHHPDIRQAIGECVREGRLDDPVIHLAAEITSAMTDAILRILLAHGFRAEPSENDFAPNTIFVAAGPPDGR